MRPLLPFKDSFNTAIIETPTVWPCLAFFHPFVAAWSSCHSCADPDLHLALHSGKEHRTIRLQPCTCVHDKDSMQTHFELAWPALSEKLGQSCRLDPRRPQDYGGARQQKDGSYRLALILRRGKILAMMLRQSMTKCWPPPPQWLEFLCYLQQFDISHCRMLVQQGALSRIL